MNNKHNKNRRIGTVSKYSEPHARLMTSKQILLCSPRLKRYYVWESLSLTLFLNIFLCKKTIEVYLLYSLSRVSKDRLEDDTVFKDQGTVFIVLLSVLTHQHEILKLMLTLFIFQYFNCLTFSRASMSSYLSSSILC